ncbi:hypothetical protein P261_00513 [Lachnospiraceae bacterium TWA4]|nr:hypothetical protein P261_00513 [Lachnospiraceae bacterium TWA4]
MRREQELFIIDKFLDEASKRLVASADHLEISEKEARETIIELFEYNDVIELLLDRAMFLISMRKGFSL